MRLNSVRISFIECYWNPYIFLEYTGRIIRAYIVLSIPSPTVSSTALGLDEECNVPQTMVFETVNSWKVNRNSRSITRVMLREHQTVQCF